MLKKAAMALTLSLWVLTVAPINSMADDFFIYPAQGQSAEKQDQDKWQCRAWATKQTGFDPAARPPLHLRRPHAKRLKGG